MPMIVENARNWPKNTVMISIFCSHLSQEELDNACVHGDNLVKLALCGFVYVTLQIIYVNNFCNINK